MIVRDWLRHPPRLVRWGLVLGWMGLIFFLSAQPDLPHAASGWLDLLVSSGAHFLLYGALALLLRWALGDGDWRPALAFGLALLYGVSDEFHQSFVPGRVPDILDIVSDGMGAALALAAWRGLRRKGLRPKPG